MEISHRTSDLEHHASFDLRVAIAKKQGIHRLSNKWQWFDHVFFRWPFYLGMVYLSIYYFCMARCQNDPTCEWLLWAASIQHVSKFWILIRMLLANGFLRSKYHDSALNGNQRSLWGAQDHKTNTSHPYTSIGILLEFLKQHGYNATKNHYLFNRDNKALIQCTYISLLSSLDSQSFINLSCLPNVLNTSMMPWCRYAASLAGTINAQHRTTHLGPQSHKNHKATGTCHSKKKQNHEETKTTSRHWLIRIIGTGWFGSFTGWFGSLFDDSIF